MSKQSETLKIASQIELAITCGFIGSAAQYAHLLLSAVSHLRRLHARNQELEGMLDSVGAGGVSAQRVTQAADHIEQPLEMVAAQETNGLLARIQKEISTAQINNHRMAAPFGKMEGEPCVRISSLLATIEGFLNEATDEQAAAPVVLPEPVAWIYHDAPTLDDFLENERSGLPMHSSRVTVIRYQGNRNETPLYTEQQVRELLAKATCTKSQTGAQEPFGYFKRDTYGWMDCSKDADGAIALYKAPQPQAAAPVVLPEPVAAQVQKVMLAINEEQLKKAKSHNTYIVGVIADKIEDGTLFDSGIYRRREIAEIVRNLLSTVTEFQVAAQEPFGYFKAEPFGWRDCAETDEGAVALYEAPQPQAVPTFTHIAERKLNELQQQGYTITGYSIEKVADTGNVERGFITHGGFVGWWKGQHANQQPPADAQDAARVDAMYAALEVCSAELFAQCSHQGRAMKYVEQARKALAAEQCARAAVAAAKEI